MTGGYSGIMEACSCGAHEAGGHVIGVTVELFEKRGPVNRWVKERVHAPDLFERLRHMVTHADGFVVVPGSIGTLTELFLTWTLLSVEGRPAAPLVLLGDHWERWLEGHRHPDLVLPHLFDHVRVTTSAAEAARIVLGAVASSGMGQG
jgi:predicted Rossmann-fold nucleotide-binding protein